MRTNRWKGQAVEISSKNITAEIADILMSSVDLSWIMHVWKKNTLSFGRKLQSIFVLIKFSQNL